MPYGESSYGSDVYGAGPGAAAPSPPIPPGFEVPLARGRSGAEFGPGSPFHPSWARRPDEWMTFSRAREQSEVARLLGMTTPAADAFKRLLQGAMGG